MSAWEASLHCNWTHSPLSYCSLQDLKVIETKSLWDSLLHLLFFHYCYTVGDSAEKRVYGMIDPISLRLRSGSYVGSYWDKTLPRIQKHVPESGAGSCQNPEHILESKNTFQNPKTLPTIRNTSQNPTILGRVFGFWDMFWILGSIKIRATVGSASRHAPRRHHLAFHRRRGS